MWNLPTIASTPLGVSFVVGLVVLIYLTLMSYSIYLPPILILSIIVAWIVYRAQQHCPNVPNVPSQ